MALSISDYLSRGAATSKEIQAATGFNQTAVSRQLKGMGDRIVTLPNGRSPKYALTCNAFGVGDKIPLYRVDAYGNRVPIAIIRPLVHGCFFVEALTDMPAVLYGEGKNGLYEGLPYFLDDLRPQGFLGRQIAKAMSIQSGDFPTDPRNWHVNHVGRYLITNGDDLPGCFQLGEQACLRLRRAPERINTADYPTLANEVMKGVIPGSSAGGEQPKFTAFCGERSAHVIVKFSPIGDHEVARRWRDILITEFHASEALQHQHFPAAETRLIELEGRLFLESQRFDRVSEYGRMPMLSLQSVDAEFTGLGSNWPTVMNALHQEGLVSADDVHHTTVLWAFGRLIHNTDMHLGNLSLGINGEVFRLLPAYDMCSMGFAPRGGEVLAYDFTPPDITASQLPEASIKQANIMAHDFWHRLAHDNRISDDFKAFLARGNPIHIE
jgi:hypothetical protein